LAMTCGQRDPRPYARPCRPSGFRRFRMPASRYPIPSRTPISHGSTEGPSERSASLEPAQRPFQPSHARRDSALEQRKAQASQGHGITRTDAPQRAPLGGRLVHEAQARRGDARNRQLGGPAMTRVHLAARRLDVLSHSLARNSVFAALVGSTRTRAPPPRPCKHARRLTPSCSRRTDDTRFVSRGRAPAPLTSSRPGAPDRRTLDDVLSSRRRNSKLGGGGGGWGGWLWLNNASSTSIRITDHLPPVGRITAPPPSGRRNNSGITNDQTDPSKSRRAVSDTEYSGASCPLAVTPSPCSLACPAAESRPYSYSQPIKTVPYERIEQP